MRRIDKPVLPLKSNIDSQQGTILVIGDIILDQYCLGDVERISPEAPVPVFNWQSEFYCLGGASNVACNVRSLGWKVKIGGFVGNDDDGKQVRRLLHSHEIDGIGVKNSLQTIKKTRVVSRGNQLIRIDYENSSLKAQYNHDELLEWFNGELSGNIKAVIISDYNKGACANFLCQEMILECTRKNIPIIVDPKEKYWEKYRGATFLTPNHKEFLQIAGISGNDEQEIRNKGMELRNQLNVDHLLITRAEKGVCLINEEGTKEYRSYANQTRNVTGAGDSLVAALAVAVAEGSGIEHAVYYANIAGGLSVEKDGTSSVNKAEIRKRIAEIESELNDFRAKIASLDEAAELVGKWKADSEKIIFTNGCFDLLHYGHIHLLKQARKFGDRLIVGINSDKSVKFLKGKKRPIIKEKDRLRIIASFDFVDCVIIFDEPTPLNLIHELQPDVIVKGGDYDNANVVGKEIVNDVVIVPLIEKYSTSSIISNILFNYSSEELI
ncbi:hypothetical protein A3844_26905 [Paenibacillus helianthi]|uniref:Bifunctional protein HldE n=1 Tax=Paenibacillus helianthi TaxID=1349432 RepID=A0ABX3EIZ5_9BACL|nr:MULTISPECIES: bifunctional heptose 7-phosphate kinase/heptose 1-phosphate adenyltransferase [Paenibacillus]OKP80715.1 hypothetical protein A3844_26905 [Paenibacillus helianthi]OKP89125.1 hypothetical protein A3848_16615 [Paenibacillus sp. P32E]